MLMIIDKSFATVYNFIICKMEKLLQKAINNPQGLNIKVLGRFYSVADGKKEGRPAVIGPRKDGKAKGYQIRQFLAQYNKENSNGKVWRHGITLFLDDDGEWLAHFMDMPNISAFGATPEKALQELETAWKLVKKSFVRKT